MSLSWRVLLTLAVVAISTSSSLPQNSSTRSSPIGEETIRLLTDQLIDTNATSQMIFDTRTPPKIKVLPKKNKTEAPQEDSHPGIAEPIDEDALILEESTKSLHYHKTEKPTTDSGLSTWILLSGQGAATTYKPIKKNVTNTFAMEDANKVIKPIFKRKTTPVPSSTTTKKPTTTAKTTVATTPLLEKTTKLTKVKASLLKNTTTLAKKTTTPTPTTTKKSATEATTKKTTTEFVKVATKTTDPNTDLNPEAKEGALDLSTTTQQSKKTKRPATTSTNPKKKKNKNRRKRPTADAKTDNTNSTKSATKLSHKNKEKPFGTQIYNYLSREVMPTVGVGLVGLMVTAGLASYFLYPFTPLRRSYDIDRKDKEPAYYYKDEYSGGIAEEDAIAKVLAGMPATNYNTRAQNSRNRYRQVDQRYMQGSVETVQLNPNADYKSAEVIVGSPKNNYQNHNDVYDNSVEDDQKFVVGNVPKEYQEVVTPAVVPEHGPRNIERKEDVFIVQSVPGAEAAARVVEHGPRALRFRRQADANEIDNEIYVGDKYTTPVTEGVTLVATTTAHPLIQKTQSILDLLKDLFFYKMRLGLQMLQNKTESLSRYFRQVQERIDDTYREVEKSRPVS